MELMASIAVIVIISLIAVNDFRRGDRKNTVMLKANVLASDIRKVQNMVLNGANFGGQELTIGGYGIYLKSDEYILFADNNSNKVYDAGEEAISKKLASTSLSATKNNLLFIPPKAQICMNDIGCADCDCAIKDDGVFETTVSYNGSSESVIVRVNQISGRVEVDTN